MIGIVVPAYNEGNNIKQLLDNITEKVHSKIEVMVVYDFEEDNTLPVLRSIKEQYPFRIEMVKNKYGHGALQAILTGMETSTQDAILVIMADLSDSLEIIDKMYDKMFQENFDLVCGSRYMKGGRQYGGPILKGLLSRMAGLSLHFLTRIPTHDISNSFKLYRKTMLNSIQIESNGGFEIGMEITVKAYLNGYKITEIPSFWYDREKGTSKFHMWKWLPHYLRWFFFCLCNTWCRNKKTTGEK